MGYKTKKNILVKYYSEIQNCITTLLFKPTIAKLTPMKLLTFTFLTLITLSSLAQNKDLPYTDGETKLLGYLASPAKKNKNTAGVVIIHAWMGLGDFEKETAQKLAKLGYLALAADIFGDTVRPKTQQEAGAQAGYYKNNRTVYRSRIQAAIDQLVKAGADPDKIAVIGYCFGGTGALEAARANMKVKGVVSFHGGLDKTPIKDSSVIVPKVLVLHGADDPFVPKEQVDAFQVEMRTTQADWQMIYYADAVHAFTLPAAGNDKTKGAAYNEKAANRAWDHCLLYLKEIL